MFSTAGKLKRPCHQLKNSKEKDSKIKYFKFPFHKIFFICFQCAFELVYPGRAGHSPPLFQDCLITLCAVPAPPPLPSPPFLCNWWRRSKVEYYIMSLE